MSIFDRVRRTVNRTINQRRREQAEEPQPPLPGPDAELTEAQKKSEEIERQRKEQAEAARQQQEAREQEVAELDAQVDELMSDDSEQFVANVKQPGGE